jgi:hypothetical protein
MPTYTYFRWERCDAPSGSVVYYREYVPPSEVVRVRRWIRRYRAEVAETQRLLTVLRRLFADEERRERQRVRVQVQVIYRPVETA